MITEQQNQNYLRAIGYCRAAREELYNFLLETIADGACIELNTTIEARNRYGYDEDLCELHYIRRHENELVVYLKLEPLNYKDKSGEYTIEDLDNNELYQLTEAVYNYFANQEEDEQ